MGSKKYLLIAVSAMLSVLMSFTCFADDRRIIVGEDGLSYCVSGNGSYFYLYDSVCIYKNGKYYKCETEWQKIDGKWYYFDPCEGYMENNGLTYIGDDCFWFDEDGVMHNGWIKYYWGEDDTDYAYYYAAPGGALTKGWRFINGKYYYFDPDTCIMLSDCLWEIEGKAYSFAKSGAMETGFIIHKYSYDDENYYTEGYYAAADGALVAGWKYIDGNWYYFDTETYMMYADSIMNIKNNYYFFYEDGRMGIGWCKRVYENWDGTTDTSWYYTDSLGHLLSGWQKIGGKWYFFDDEGYDGDRQMFSDDSYRIGDKIYLFTDSGALVSEAGWVKLGGCWYYSKSNGTPEIGWKQIGGVWYYFDPEYGEMCSSLRAINGYLNDFASNGAWRGKVTTPGWRKCYDSWYYVKSNGKAAIGWESINGKWYYFYENGTMAVYSVLVGEKCYFMEESGALTTTQGWKSEMWGDEKVWFYTDTNGVCRRGWQSIKGKWYYFATDAYAIMCCDEWYEIEGIEYRFDENGVYTGEKYDPEEMEGVG
ncbi:MAG: hypothetical protein IKN24_07305 [Lachnospiraceae bacterium]|nr:hypothetical protein [Lachnospiraceae bacterium]